MSNLLHEVFRGAGTYIDKAGRRYRLDANGKRVPLSNAPVPDEKIVSHPKPERITKRPAAPERANKGSKLKEFMSGKPKKMKSSYIEAGKYDSENSILRISFNNMPGVWHKYTVTPDIAKGFFEAPSKGEFFHTHIKGRGSKRGEHIVPYLGHDEEEKKNEG
jgi:hypothetical protein